MNNLTKRQMGGIAILAVLFLGFYTFLGVAVGFVPTTIAMGVLAVVIISLITALNLLFEY